MCENCLGTARATQYAGMQWIWDRVCKPCTDPWACLGARSQNPENNPVGCPVDAQETSWHNPQQT
eukprot:7012464-Lingulodinium_polyedra.AAC.1